LTALRGAAVGQEGEWVTCCAPGPAEVMACPAGARVNKASAGGVPKPHFSPTSVSYRDGGWEFVLASFLPLSYGPRMTEPDPKLTLADPDDLSNSLSFALRFEGKRRYNDSDRFAADIIAARSVRHLDRSGYVVMKKPPLGGHSQLARGFGQRD
jgi:hypothetical protein